ncbi:hypothetical protein DGo_PE0027 (plasmid) [Deinococcus gobiensis I-0]|uniref:Uncharacterized protein n=1 Tax=Deinococcus gobiensis (strain DSM 21396 / JCM 16679 / CGMCC 1.7299 / I-0) TaxID=745776 RepID=H8H3S4_DEIGI|nr:hypothetical protein DGo_PE0027 [Deinococcus gobiensis I-0]
MSAGPSPRLWGTLLENDHRVYAVRSIPTPVGNTARRAVS